MKLIFGAALDGRSYPDFDGAGGWLDAAAVGPMGLVQTLEIQLGMTRPATPEAVRIAAYVAKLAQALADKPDAFFARSFERDQWTTGRELLKWRDALVAAGWRGTPCSAPRIDTLADVERAGPALPFGLSDRAAALCVALGAGMPIALDEVRLVEFRDRFEPCWRRLIEALEARGVPVRDHPLGAVQVCGSDLAIASGFLSSGDSGTLTGDGSLVLLGADTALMAAEAVADWIAAGGEDRLAGTVVIAEGRDTALLDRALVAQGLPALGHSAASPWRGTLQVLVLAFAIAWRPFDARALLDLLTLPSPPIGRSTAARLARALVEEPGSGGAKWAEAWTAAEADLLACDVENPKHAAVVAQRLERWRAWTVGGSHHQSEGMPASAVLEIAARVRTWATGTDDGAGGDLLMALAAAADAMERAVVMLGKDRLPKLLVDRLIEDVLATGCRNPDHLALAGGLRSVENPAAIWAPAKIVIWWDFAGPGRKPDDGPWTTTERAALAATGCKFQPECKLSGRVATGHANAVLMTSEQLILVRSALNDGGKTVSHPLSHQLDPLTGPAGDRVRWRAERILCSNDETLAGRPMVRAAIPIIAPPAARPTWVVPQGIAHKLLGRLESATSFERLVDCQMRWLVRDVLRVTPGRFAELPSADRLLGMLAHAVAAKVFLPGLAPTADEMFDRACVEFEILLPKIAAPLEQPEFAGELAAARSRVPAALAHLAGILHVRGLEIVGTEVSRKADFGEGLVVTGQLDLLVRHPAHGLGVLDLKWSRSPKRRVTELSEGRAVQLATYGAIAGPHEGGHAQGSYYLLAQRRLVGVEGSAFCEEAVETARDLPKTWLDLVATWRHWRDAALSGRAVAAGLPAEEGQDVADVPFGSGHEPCKFCEFTALCRVAALEV